MKKKKIPSFPYQLHFLKVWIKGKFFYIMVIINLNVLYKNVKEFPAIIDPFTFGGPLLAWQGNNNILLATQMCGQGMLQELIIIWNENTI